MDYYKNKYAPIATLANVLHNYRLTYTNSKKLCKTAITTASSIPSSFKFPIDKDLCASYIEKMRGLTTHAYLIIATCQKIVHYHVCVLKQSLAYLEDRTHPLYPKQFTEELSELNKHLLRIAFDRLQEPSSQSQTSSMKNVKPYPDTQHARKPEPTSSEPASNRVQVNRTVEPISDVKSELDTKPIHNAKAIPNAESKHNTKPALSAKVKLKTKPIMNVNPILDTTSLPDVKPIIDAKPIQKTMPVQLRSLSYADRLPDNMKHLIDSTNILTMPISVLKTHPSLSNFVMELSIKALGKKHPKEVQDIIDEIGIISKQLKQSLYPQVELNFDNLVERLKELDEAQLTHDPSYADFLKTNPLNERLKFKKADIDETFAETVEIHLKYMQFDVRNTQNLMDAAGADKHESVSDEPKSKIRKTSMMKCPACMEYGHVMADCKTYPTAEARIAQCRLLDICTNCLWRHSVLTDRCKSGTRSSCHYCESNHKKSKHPFPLCPIRFS